MTTRRRVIEGNDEVLQAYRRERETRGTPDDEAWEEEWILERDKHLPLRFWGNRIGHARHVHTSEKRGERGTDVSLYVTAGGKLVTYVQQWAKPSKPGGQAKQRKVAKAHGNPKEALAWLIEDANGVLGTTSKEAWLEACRSFEPLAHYAVEDVD